MSSYTQGNKQTEIHLQVSCGEALVPEIGVILQSERELPVTKII